MKRGSSSGLGREQGAAVGPGTRMNRGSKSSVCLGQVRALPEHSPLFRKYTGMERDLRPVAPAPGGSCPHPSATAQPPPRPPLRPWTRQVRWGGTSCPQASPERPALQVDSRRGSGPSAHIGPDHVPRTPRGTPDGRQRCRQKEVRVPSPSREPSS